MLQSQRSHQSGLLTPSRAMLLAACPPNLPLIPTNPLSTTDPQSEFIQFIRKQAISILWNSSQYFQENTTMI